jgi:hypothetical protein
MKATRSIRVEETITPSGARSFVALMNDCGAADGLFRGQGATAYEAVCNMAFSLGNALNAILAPIRSTVLRRMNRDRVRVLDAEIRALYVKRRPLTRSLRLQADSEKSAELAYVDAQIDERELEYERLMKVGA